ncbi:MAG: hypothetical protein M5U12_22610 [Verrucomicrobia bacterium]|nr:hypothetical protein [Verrucomicrobiota bacterium]
MKRIAQTLLTGLTATPLALSLVVTAALPPGAAPVTLSFEKCLADPNTGLFIGTVSGECGDGSVVYETLRFDASQAVWELEGWYQITTADCSFTAHCAGKANTHNGVIVLNGEVTVDSADFAGARVQVRAQLLIGENSLCSAGTITLTPGGTD